MKKVFKIIGIILLIIIAVAIVILIIASHRQFVPKDYSETTKTGGDIEKKYIQEGKYKVKYKEYGLLQDFKKIEVYYPEDLENQNKKYPLVVFSNGSGLPASKYHYLLEHLASWGFIAVGNEEEYAWNGMSSETTMRVLLDISDKETIGDKKEVNPLYNKIDFNNVGITGHSQGGVGVFNAITMQEHKDIYKCAVALSPTKISLADNLYWHYDAENINTPILLFAGTTEGSVADGDSLKDTYDKAITSTKVMATRDNATHNELLYFSDGYVTAWFMYFLQNDEEASKAFFGDNAEIISNKLYQNVNKSI